MGYRFTGFFTNADAVETKRLCQRWPGSRFRRISHPFVGSGVAFPNYDDVETEAEAARILGLIERAQEELLLVSELHPSSVFVCLEVDCIGGICANEGFVCQGGKIIARESGDWALARLMRFLGVGLNEDQYLVPLARGFFDRPKTWSPLHRFRIIRPGGFNGGYWRAVS